MKKTILISLALSFVSLFTFAQTGQFGLQTEVGGGVGLGSGNYSTLQFHVSPGIRINSSFFVGLGVGLNYQLRSQGVEVWHMAQYPVGGPLAPYYKDKNNSFFSIPVYAHATYTLPTKGLWAPYVNLKLGYGIVDYTYSVESSYGNRSYQTSGGLYVSPALGVKYKLNDKHALSFSVSYDMQSYKTSGYPISEFWESKEYMTDQRQTGSLSFRLGWEF